MQSDTSGSQGRLIWRICSRLVRCGDRPPCIQRTRLAISPAIGIRLKNDWKSHHKPTLKHFLSFTNIISKEKTSRKILDVNYRCFMVKASVEFVHPYFSAHSL